jgi:hypothetical protein
MHSFPEVPPTHPPHPRAHPPAPFSPPPADGIYREDLEFKDPNLTFRGLKNYRIITWSLRFHGCLFLRAANVQILRIWQPEDAVIK